MSRAFNRVLCAAILAGTLSACGGGGGSGGVGTEPLVAGIEGSGHRVTSGGAVTALGSIFVNGVEYDTRTATITIDGLPARDGDLDVGQVAIVEGTLNANGTTGVATRVTIGIALAGPVSALDESRNRLTILGQVVELDAATQVEGRNDNGLFGGLAIGSDVEVTGFVDSSGVLFARRIAPRRPTTPLLLTGYATNVDETARTFRLGAQPLSYATATLAGFGSRSLAGAPVRVEVQSPSGTPLVAGRIDLRDLRLPGNAGDAVVLQGWVTRFGSASDFDVDGHAVVTTASTITQGPVNGSSVVRLDAFVTLTGKLLANGVVEAAEVRTNNLIALASTIYGTGEVEGLPGRYLLADLWEWSGDRCRLAPQTSISVDGVAAGVDALVPGEVADIYEHWVNVTVDNAHVVQESICQSVAIAHAIRGPLESGSADSNWFTVMGQRVWFDTSPEVVAKGVDVHGALASLTVGSVVEVSGHLTAEGDVLATGVHAAAAGDSYHVTGIARDVDSVTRQLRLGSLIVYYGDADIVGFAGAGPAPDDRVFVRAESPPGAGVLRASLVRYAGGLPRGADGTGVRLGGLITSYTSPAEFAVDGRKTVAHDFLADPSAAAALRCDVDKFHPNLRFVNLLAFGLAAAETPRYFFAVCPPGRRMDSRGPPNFDEFLEAPRLIGPIEGVDVAQRLLRVAGFELKLSPDALLTRYVATAPDGSGVTTPLALADLQLGERIEIAMYVVTSGVNVVQSVVVGDHAVAEHVVTHVPDGNAAAATSEVLVSGVVEVATEAGSVLVAGVPAAIDATTVLLESDCGSILPFTDAAAFWNAVTEHPFGTITGHMLGSTLVAERAYLSTGSGAHCYGW